jgi:dephospho-CoA kinase
MKRKRIAVTGGAATGKSTVLAMVADLGIPVASADALIREAWDSPEIGPKFAEAVGMAWPIDRDEVRRRVFANDAFRASLEAVIHPWVRDALRQSGATVEEVPLLTEATQSQEYDEVWLTECDAGVQEERLRARGWSEEQIAAMRRVQPSDAQRRAMATQIIRTDEALAHVRHCVRTACVKAGIL